MNTAHKTKRQTPKTIANVFGTLGYFSVLLQWTWVLLLLCYPLLTVNHSFLLPDAPAEPFHPTHNAVTESPITTVAAITISAFVLIATAVVITRLPKQIGKRGARLTHQTADAILPIVTKHKVLPQKKRRALSYRIILLAKLTFIILPVIGLSWVVPSDPLTVPVVWTIGLYCAGWSIIYFAVQQMIGFFAKVDTRRLW
ncbi:MAG TPA: hypothetical protein VLF64_02070 [Candidatus Saccharimonadales bacterium]|nr:hypothetical protein [Candidatus Saccharimonadales bacterium]